MIVVNLIGRVVVEFEGIVYYIREVVNLDDYMFK